MSKHEPLFVGPGGPVYSQDKVKAEREQILAELKAQPPAPRPLDKLGTKQARDAAAPAQDKQTATEARLGRTLRSFQAQAEAWKKDRDTYKRERDQARAEADDRLKHIIDLNDAATRFEDRAKRAEAQVADLVAALQQATEALASIEGKARTMKVVNAYCRTQHAIARADSTSSQQAEKGGQP